EARPARITFTADGAAKSSFKIDGKFAGADLNASATGTVTSSGGATLDVSLRGANTKLPHRVGSAAVPADLRARGAIDGNDVAVTDLSGKVAGATVKGRLTLGLGEPLRVNGRIETDQMDAGELFAVFTGAPRTTTGGRSAEWVVEPFGQPAAPALEGRVEFRTANAQWLAGIVTKDLVGAVKFEPSGFSLADVSGLLADGRLALDAEVRRERAGVSLHSHVKLSNADIPVLLAGALRVPAAGRISLEADLQGQGLSPASLAGATKGAGTVTAENVEIAGLDPTAINAVIKALELDRGLVGNPGRVTQIANAGLDAGKLRIPSVGSAIVLADGRAQLANISVPTQNADISGSISLTLADWQLEARLAMMGPSRQNATTAERPAMAVTVRGPLTGARRFVDISDLIGWATMRAVDQEAKRLDDAEKERQRLEAAVEALRRLPDTATVAPPQTGTLPTAPAPQSSTATRAADLPSPTDSKSVAPSTRPAPPLVPPPPEQPNPLNRLKPLPPGTR